MQLVISCIPLIIFIIVVKVLKIKFNNYVNIGLLSFLATILTMYIFNPIITVMFPILENATMIGGVLAFLYYLLYAGVVEELTKFLCLKISKPKAKSQVLLNLVLIGTLYGVIENYAYFSMDLSTKTTIFRCFDMHILFASVMGLILVTFEEKNNKSVGNLVALVVTILLHGIWDFANGSIFDFIIGGIICYSAMIFVLKKAKKYQDAENALVESETVPKKKDKLLIPKIILLVLLIFFWFVNYSSYDSRTELSEACTYNDIEIKVLEAENLTNTSGQKYIRVKVNVKNNSSKSVVLESISGFQLVRLDNGEAASSDISFSIGDSGELIEYEILANGENEGYLYFGVDGKVSEYKLTYSNLNDRNKCNMNIS